MSDLLAHSDPLVATLVLFAAMVLARVVGWQVGRRERARTSPDEIAHAADIARACLALASLLLAFTFGTGYSKYEQRRTQTVDEANAIGTLHLRLELLPGDARDAARADLREYVHLHLVATTAGLPREKRLAVEAEIRAVQDRFAHTIVGALQGERSAPLIVTTMTALNAVLDAYETRIAGLDAHVPFAVMLLLLGTTVISLGLLGWSEALAMKRRIHSTLAFLVLVTLALYVTFDLDRPFTGASRVSELPMQRLAARLGVSVP